MRRATALPSAAIGKWGNFYPRSPCGERQQAQTLKIPAHRISIHALLAESDAFRQLQSALCRDFYPRSPCGERQVRRFCATSMTEISIHALLAESDANFLKQLYKRGNFYPRSPCGERPPLASGAESIAAISIHALLAESDGGSVVGSWPRVIFLSTLSLRRATVAPLLAVGRA